MPFHCVVVCRFLLRSRGVSVKSVVYFMLLIRIKSFLSRRVYFLFGHVGIWKCYQLLHIYHSFFNLSPLLSLLSNSKHCRVDSLKGSGYRIVSLVCNTLLSPPFQQLEPVFLLQILLHESYLLKQHELAVLETGTPALSLTVIGIIRVSL